MEIILKNIYKEGEKILEVKTGRKKKKKSRPKKTWLKLIEGIGREKTKY